MKVIVSSAPAAQAAAIGKALVEAQLVACVNLLPGALAIYEWKGSVEQESETLLFMETSAHAVPAAMRELARLHPYEVPKILALDVTDVADAYAAWVAERVPPPGAASQD